MARRENTARKYRVMFNLKPGGSYTPRITVPDSLLRDIGVRPGDSIIYTPVENGILITRSND